MAVKANPVAAFLKEAVSNGLGLECASFGEVSEALAAGADPKKIVFDSPAKTKSELKFSLEKGLCINLDNFQELDRVKELMVTGKYHGSRIGIRINPQVGAGTIGEMSTATQHSKFGIPLKEYKEELLAAYSELPWLVGIHVHVGSQGCPLSLMVNGARAALDFAEEINAKRGSQQITFLDLGGGLPVNFDSDEQTPTFSDWKQALEQALPELFSGKYQIITECGRAYNAKSGLIISRVEYTKVVGGRNIAMVHVGADLMVRTVYMPTKWPVRVSVADGTTGDLKSGPLQEYDVAGPCCFAADIVAHQRPLPKINPGDYVVCHDTGAYYYGAFSYYNSRQPPPIYGVEFGSDGVPKLTLLKKAQTVEDTLNFFA